MIFKPTGYNKKYLITHPWVWLRSHWHDITNAWERAKKGHSWRDLSNMDDYLYQLIYDMLMAMQDEENNCGSYPSRTNPIDWQNELQDCANAFKKLCDATWEEQFNDKEWKQLKKDAFEKLYNIIDDLWN